MNSQDHKPLTARMRQDGEPVDIRAYEQAGGYEGLRRALSLSPADVRKIVDDADLRGRGGAGFPAGKKWSSVPTGEQATRPKYVIANADEMEPGTFKDRLLVERDPHQLIEGLLIAAYAMGAEHAYVLLRWAYRRAAAVLRRAMEEASLRGYLGANILGSSFSVDMRLHISAGRYMCGEEGGLIDSMEGKRAVPRPKPPLVSEIGLWGKPTVVNNVETLCCVPHILRNGAAWFVALGRTKESGTKLYGASGRVKRPGLWELPMGTTLGEIVNDWAGGMQDGYTFRGALPGGASCNFVLPEHFGIPMDFDSMQKANSRLGTGTVVVMDNRTCPVGFLLSLETFFARESCGWCTPCREGLPWVVHILQALEAGTGRPDDLDVLDDHVRLIRMNHTFCALAPGAMMPLKGALEYFREDLLRHIQEKRCPWN